ncbi:hypothetical protein Q5752_006785 [Cryptotrichosporon argae]
MLIPRAQTAHVILLPPPRELLYAAPYFDALTNALAARNANKTFKAWVDIHGAQLATLVAADLWRKLSDCIVALLRPPTPLNLGDLARNDPERFGWVRDVALEAAARDEWRGLFEFVLCLIDAGRPEDSMRTIDEYRLRFRAVKGIDKADLNSTSKEKRVAARITTDGSRALALAYLIAMAMLDRMGGEYMLNLVDLSPSLYKTDIACLDAVYDRLRAHARSGPAASAAVRRFSSLRRAAELAMMCHHPSEMINRIQGLADTHRFDLVEKLYDEIMDGSIGPDRYIQPWDLDDIHTRYFDVIPITVNIWLKFIVAFHAGGNHDALVRMIEIDMPARGLVPTPRILANAMHAHGWLARGPFQREIRAASAARAKALWERLVREGTYLDDESVSKRMIMLRDDKRLDAAYDLYEQARASWAREGKRDGTLSDASYVEIAISANHIDRAMDVLERAREPGLSRRWARLAHGMLRAVAAERWRPHQHRLDVLQRLQQRRPAHAMFTNETHGIVLQIVLLKDVIRSEARLLALVRASLDHLHSDHLGGSTTKWFASFLRGLLGRKALPQPDHLRAAVLVLEEFRHRNVGNATPQRVLRLWQGVLAAITDSTTVSESMRNEFAGRALQAYADGPGTGAIAEQLRMVLVRQAFARTDVGAIALGMDQWAFVRRRARASMWHMVLTGLAKHGFTAAARGVCADAPRVLGVEAAANMTAFWISAVKLGVLAEGEKEELLEGVEVDGRGGAVAEENAADDAIYEDDDEADDDDADKDEDVTDDDL